jgi:hypothetical protein
MSQKSKPEKITKFERVYEDETSISIWKYDYSKTTSGPVSVEHKWKRGVEIPTTKKKTLGDLVKNIKPVNKSQRPKS